MVERDHAVLPVLFGRGTLPAQKTAWAVVVGQMPNSLRLRVAALIEEVQCVAALIEEVHFHERNLVPATQR